MYAGASKFSVLKALAECLVSPVEGKSFSM